MACGILASQPRMQSGLARVKVWSLNHWATRERPLLSFLTGLSSLNGTSGMTMWFCCLKILLPGWLQGLRDWENRRVAVNGDSFFGCDKNALKLTVKMASQLCEYVNTHTHTHTHTQIDLYPLNGWTEWYVNYISIKQLEIVRIVMKITVK